MIQKRITSWNIAVSGLTVLALPQGSVPVSVRSKEGIISLSISQPITNGFLESHQFLVVAEHEPVDLYAAYIGTVDSLAHGCRHVFELPVVAS